MFLTRRFAPVGQTVLITMLLLSAKATRSDEPGQEKPVSTTPRDVAALRALQERVQTTTQKVLPAMVAVKNAYSPAQSDAKPRKYQPYCSGVIITADGLVLSQFHVSHRLKWKHGEPIRSLQPGDRTSVILGDGRKVDAELLGADQRWDVSLLRLLEPGPYPHVPLQPATPVKLGDWVMKFGHPLGYRDGRPAVARLGRVLYQDDQVFVTDCVIEGGDSGGPLIDLDGRVVGILGSTQIPKSIEDVGGQDIFHHCVNSSIVADYVPGMLRGEMTEDQTPLDKDYLTTKNILPPPQWTQGATTAAAFQKVAEPARSSVVEIRDQSDRQVALGTVVDPEGLVLTVASLVPNNPTCRLPDGLAYSAKVVGINPAYDMALLRIPAHDLRPVEWKQEALATVAGTLLVAPVHATGQNSSQLATGIVSVPTRSLGGPFPEHFERRKPKATRPGLWGTKTADGLQVEKRNQDAVNAGILKGDVVVSIDGTPVHDEDDLSHWVRGHFAGEQVLVHVLRDGKPLDLSFELAAEPLLSAKPSSDFPTLFENDIPLPIHQCGGPVVDLDGRAVGINGYSGSYGCFAIPADVVQQLLPELKAGKCADDWEKATQPATR